MSEMSQTDPAERDTAICDLGRHIGSRISRRDATPSGYVDGRPLLREPHTTDARNGDSTAWGILWTCRTESTM